MRTRRTPVLPALLALALGLAGCGAGSPPASAVALRTSATDPEADVYDDDDKLVQVPHADVVSAGVTRTATKLELRYATRTARDPVGDPNWTSDSTYTDILLETTGDADPDFDVEYGVSEGELYVDVYRVDDRDEPPVLCAGDAEFTGDTHVATVALACLGDPATVGYRVETVYDQDVAAEDSRAAYDFAPDEGFVTLG
ncbi:hypothetical protein GCM10010124_36350 [Pilimelia terevasa]|uniref:Lipoprotein n=1 Tax=Pilimelia terevasa TaxID=53372 RepID=A0A8J3BTC8_9ACTN|nr:hypothetical protein [Pilimelia terevasa]GGK40346.1 hypothetical protein GCM10010124_36350 [Pilimelia terevasa]